MSLGVNGRAAAVHANAIPFRWGYRFRTSRKRVVQNDFGHGISVAVDGDRVSVLDAYSWRHRVAGRSTGRGGGTGSANACH